MIKVNKDYVIDADELCYAVKLDKHKTYTDKTGNVRKVYDIKGYYNTLESALGGIKKYMIIDSIKDKDVDLDEAIAEIRKINEDFQKSFRKAMGNI